jgi:choline dehydrogenase-like flavoprotein
MILNNLDELQGRCEGSARTVIAGAGTLGLYVAVELAKRGHQVVLIEAGDEILGNFAPATYQCIGRKHQGIVIGRSRSLGGTSNLWGGQLVEFQPVDISGREWLSDSKWPLSYEEIESYYRPTYENLGIAERFHDDDEILLQVLGELPGFDEGAELFLTRWLKIPSFALAYQEEIQTNERISLFLNHTTTGIKCVNGTVTGLEVKDAKGKEQFVSGDRFILALGTIEIVRLLLHCASDPIRECPWRDNQNLGTHFQDHVGGRVASVHPLDKAKFFKYFSTIVRSGHKFQPKIRLQNEILESVQLLNIQGMFAFESSVAENLVFLKQFLKAAIYSRKISGIKGLFANLWACGRHLFPLMWKYVVQNRIFVPSSSKISFMVQSEQTPIPASRISIDTSVQDVYGLPKVLLDWKIGDHELVSIRDFTLRCQKALFEAGLAEMKVSEALISLDSSFLEGLLDNYHLVGGARMGFSREDGVVDSDLRVFETTNLYVVGASTFRTTSNANTTFVALALATRLVEKLNQQGLNSKE